MGSITTQICTSDHFRLLMIYCKARYVIIEVIIDNWQGVRYLVDALQEVCEYLRFYVYQNKMFEMTKELVS